MDDAARALAPGAIVDVQVEGAGSLGTAFFNPHSLIAARVLDRKPGACADEGWIEERIARALRLRDSLIPGSGYRWVHAEADGLPGLVIDRYGDAVAIQLNTAGMDRFRDAILAAIRRLIPDARIVLRCDSPVRRHEGLDLYVEALDGFDGKATAHEAGAWFDVDLADGQKTGWFYDQRDNRLRVAGVAAGRSVLDVYTYAGGFAVQAARAGATRVVAIDRSEASLALAAQSALRNGVQHLVTTERSDALEAMGRMAARGERFGVVIVDPPAFAKSRKDLEVAASGYRRMARAGAQLVESDGWLFTASCSHHMPAERFYDEIAQGIRQAGRVARAVWTGGAGCDHPLHPFLPESAYLKAVLWAVD